LKSTFSTIAGVMLCAIGRSCAAWVSSAHTAASQANVSQDGLLIGFLRAQRGNIDTGVGRSKHHANGG
jgi:hypothetical protein